MYTRSSLKQRHLAYYNVKLYRGEVSLTFEGLHVVGNRKRQISRSILKQKMKREARTIILSLSHDMWGEIQLGPFDSFL